MTMQTRGSRWVAMALAAALALATVAPAAEAGRKYKHKGGKSRVKVTRVVHHAPQITRVVHRSCGEPSFATFVGGVVLGAALSQIGSQPAYAAPVDDYYYYDPYCEQRFVSLAIYRGHFRNHRHPQVVRVITVRDDRCVDNLRYHDGQWRHWEYDRDRDYDRWEDRGYYGD